VIARLASRFGRIVVAHPIAVLAATLAVSAFAIVPASRLTIRSDVSALLPRHAPAASAYRTFLENFGGIESVYVVIRRPDGAPADPEGLADAAETLARELSRSPEVAHARWGLDEEDEAFFTDVLAPRLPLLLGDDPAPLLAKHLTDDALREDARRLRDAADGPGALFLTRLAAADPLGLSEAKLRELAASGTLPFDPITGALLSPDGRAALVVVTPVKGESDAAGGRALAAALDAALARTRAEDGGALEIESVGGPLYAAHDETALRADLIRILGTASFLVLGLIVLAFGGVAIPSISIATVAVGQLVCAAVVALGYGPVTAVGVGFAAILLGLGDDFTLHLGARARSLWLSGTAPEAAVEGAIVETAPGIVAAGLTTAAAFGCLAFAHFRPLAELGLVVALGMLLLLVATALVAAPLLALIARRWKSRPARERGRSYALVVEAGLRWSQTRRATVLVVASLATLLAVAGIARLRLDTDLRRMRPEDHPAVRAERRLVASFAVPLDTATVLVPGRDESETLDRADAVASLLRAKAPGGAEVSSPSDWIVTGSRSARRVAALSSLALDRAADRLAEALDREGLRKEAFAPALDAMRALGAGRDPSPVPLERYPAWMREGLRAVPAGVLAAVRVRVPEGAWAGGPPPDLLREIERVAPGAAVASAPALGAELRALALSDLKRLGALAVGIVFLLVLLSYRGDVRTALLTFVPVLLGVIWTAGAWGLVGRPLDLFSLCVLPVMVGIGIDDGLHVLHLARGSGRDLAEAARDAGRGVVLTNLTTSAGFAALAVSHVPALRNGGLIVCAGNLLCLVATLFVLPAVASSSRRS